MNSSEIINDNMTLEEKMEAIQKAMETAQVKHKEANPNAAPLDPADLLMCEGCQ